MHGPGELRSNVAFIGMPFHQGNFGRPGARFGPDAIRDTPRTYSYLAPYSQQKEAEGFSDIDVMAPSQAPATGTPDIGGLFYHEVRDCLAALVRGSPLWLPLKSENSRLPCSPKQRT